MDMSIGWYFCMYSDVVLRAWLLLTLVARVTCAGRSLLVSVVEQLIASIIMKIIIKNNNQTSGGCIADY